MIKNVVFKVKSGHLEQWRSWCNKLMTSLHTEGLNTLREEQVTQEVAFIFEIKGESYVLGFAEGDMLPADMSREINKKHKQAKEECLEFIGHAETLYSLKIS